MDVKKVELLVRELLVAIGENPDREGLRATPARVARSLEFLTDGYRSDPKAIVNNAVFESDADEMVVVKDIEFYSLCEHHMLPFFGKAAVAYMPNESIIGLSKIARIVDMFARRFQVQERLTNQIAETLRDILDPYGVAVVMEGKHLCMMMRGVEKQNSFVTSSAMIGEFKNDRATRMELLSLLNSRNSA